MYIYIYIYIYALLVIAVMALWHWVEHYDGAELYKLTGICKQPFLKDMLNKKAVGLYRDDELIVLNKINNQQTD